ncbi:hypothetical protein Y032_0044g1063 [Ancylostoma ceylanicum]|uniref:Uncharacterized protein n=1 Tax=Ancylostoma ceylanicum TaxID=53326 RepID=A0A016UDL7_9BILA|nr:hypothetical protein Y032_0044g1063 [Ancylostoma ceylanicum]
MVSFTPQGVSHSKTPRTSGILPSLAPRAYQRILLCGNERRPPLADLSKFLESVETVCERYRYLAKGFQDSFCIHCEVCDRSEHQWKCGRPVFAGLPD